MLLDKDKIEKGVKLLDAGIKYLESKKDFSNLIDYILDKEYEKLSADDRLYYLFYIEEKSEERRENLRRIINQIPTRERIKDVTDFILSEIGKEYEEEYREAAGRFTDILFKILIGEPEYEKVAAEIRRDFEIGEILKDTRFLKDKFDLFTIQEGKEFINESEVNKYFTDWYNDFSEKKDHGIIPGTSLAEVYISEEICKLTEDDGCDAEDFILKWNEENIGKVMFLLGEPGQGKSMICKKMVYNSCINRAAGTTYAFPLNNTDSMVVDEDITGKKVVRLERALVSNNFFNMDEINSVHIKKRIQKLKQSDFFKDVLIFLDGYDELYMDLNSAGYSLNNFCDEIKTIAQELNCNIIVTSRKTCFDSKGKFYSLREMMDCEVYSICSLTYSQQETWIEKYSMMNIEHKSGFCIDDLRNIDEKLKELIEIPLLFQLIVHNNFKGTAENRAELYFNLFKETIYKNYDENSKMTEKEATNILKRIQGIAYRIYENNDKFFVENASMYLDIEKIAILFYFRVGHNCQGEECKEEKYQIEFLHRSFYQYFLAYYLYELYCASDTQEKAENFLAALYPRRLEIDVLNFIEEIFAMKGYSESIDPIVIKSIETTNCILPCVLNCSNRLEYVSNVFVNAMSILSQTCKEDKEKNISSDIICNLIRTYDCTEIVLKNIKFNYEFANLAGARLAGSNLAGSNLAGANLVGTNLSEANLVGANLEYAHLEYASLSEAHLEYANLSEANLEYANLYGANLEYAHLEYASLYGANLEYAHLEYASLYGAHLEGAHLKGAHLEGAHLKGAHLEEAHLKGAHLKGAHLKGAHLEGAHLYGAHLDGVHLDGAYLEGAHLDVAYLNSENGTDSPKNL